MRAQPVQAPAAKLKPVVKPKPVKRAAVAKHPVSKIAQFPRVGSIVWPYFDVAGAVPSTASAIPPQPITDYHGRYRRWLARGVYLPPSAYEVCFLSAAHTTADLDTLLDVLEQS